MKNLLHFTETFNWIAMVSIVGGYLRQIKDKLFSLFWIIDKVLK